MTKRFTFNSKANPDIQGPIWCDYDQNSDYSKKLIHTKQTNDHNYWSNMRDILQYDYDNLPLERFKVWMSVMSVPFMSNIRHSNYIKDALNMRKEAEEALLEPMIGLNQQDFENFYKVFNDFPTTMNRMQHLGHLIKCGITPDNLKNIETITEVGGGIGEMTDIIYKLGFKGKYILYDFPEVGNIQKYHHNKLGLDKVTHTFDMNDLSKSDLVIGTWSITEAPIDIRNEMVDRLEGSKDWLLAYSNGIFGLDNANWIKDVFVPKMKGSIDIIDIPEMSWDQGTHYCSVKGK